MNDWGKCQKCDIGNTMDWATDWEGYECRECSWTQSSYCTCPNCKGTQKIGTPACGCGSCKKCGYRVSCVVIQPHSWDIQVPQFPIPFEHSWKNFEVDKTPYICRCDEEFDTHQELMDHTAELNALMNSEDFGRAGAGIEREAHKRTLKDFDEAIDFLLCLVGDDSTHYEIAEDIKQFLIRIDRYTGEEL